MNEVAPFGRARRQRRCSLAAAAFALAPLLWMVSVSFMQPGEASSYPPPLLPSKPTLEHYRELFAQAGIGRYLLNSLAIACGDDAIVDALQRDGRLRVRQAALRGRERSSRRCSAALVIPGQVAMMPLFLMLKGMGLVNT